MNKIKQVLSDEGWKSKVLVELWCYRQCIWDCSECWYVQKTLHLFQFVFLMILCIPLNSVCHRYLPYVFYFNCVCFTVIFLGKIASLSILLQAVLGLRPWWILRLYIAFWLTLGCVLHLLKLKVYIFVLRIYLRYVLENILEKMYFWH